MTPPEPHSTEPAPPVIAFTLDLGSEGIAPALAEAWPGTEVINTPYVESEELRSVRGHHGGRNPDGLPTPDITDELRAAWAETTVLVAMDVPDELPTLMPKLQWIQSITAGYEKYDLGALAGQQVKLSTASGMGAAGIAEFVFARILQEYKWLRGFDEQQDRQQWEGRFGSELTGRTLGVAGLGAIGREIAVRARAFGMTVVATRGSARPGDSDPDVDELYPAAELHTMLGRCDIVAASLPANETTIGLFDADAFAAMPAGSMFCNVGRGAHVIEADLIAALESEHLRAAALDVTQTEPLPAEDPLWQAPNLYLSPHSSVSLDRYAQNFQALLAENVDRFRTGERLRNEVDLS